jgi:hypothetical protein
MRGWPLTVDHIVPYSAATREPSFDPEDPDNLAAACWMCNFVGKHAQTHGLDPLSGLIVPLFHPRHDRWTEHFSWTTDYLRLRGGTPSGWATIRALRLNGPRYRTQRRLLRLAMAAGGPVWP